MGNRLKGRNAVITGGGRGIGRAVALAMAEEGANIVVCDLGVATNGTRPDKVPAAAVTEECRKLGVKAVPHYGDVADFKAAEDMIKTCVDSFGRIDILCNFAASGRFGPIWDMSEEEWDRTLAVAVKGTFNLCRHACPLMRQQRYGRILNVTSHERLGNWGAVHGCASKGAIASLTYAIAWEMGTYGVTCNALSPAARTRWMDDPDVLANFQKRVEAGFWSQEMFEQSKRIAPPEMMGVIAAFLCSEAASHINGCIISAGGHAIASWSPEQEKIVFARDWEKYGRWSWEEIEGCMPALLRGYVNPSPPRDNV
jgi:3-oxoacyl-[acyl-carrier protein] reductase